MNNKIEIQELPDWKERLGYTTSIILIWSIVFIKLFPIASKIQLPHGSQFLTPDGSAYPNFPIYIFLVGLISFGATILVLSIKHILSRGIWMSKCIDAKNVEIEYSRLRDENPDIISHLEKMNQIDWKDGEKIRNEFSKLENIPNLNKLSYYKIMDRQNDLATKREKLVNDIERLSGKCNKTFKSFFAISSYAFSSLWLYPIILLSCTIQILFHGWLNIESNWLGGILLFIIMIILVIALLILFILIAKLFEIHFPTGRSIMELWKKNFNALFLFLFIFTILSHLTKTTFFEVNNNVFSKSKNELVEINIELGGSTSKLENLSVKLIDPSKNVLKVENLERIQGGNYLALITCDTLLSGTYYIDFEYKGFNISYNYPLISRNIRNRKGFVVVE